MSAPTEVRTSADLLSCGVGHERRHQSMHAVLVEVVEEHGLLHQVLRRPAERRREKESYHLLSKLTVNCRLERRERDYMYFGYSIN